MRYFTEFTYNVVLIRLCVDLAACLYFVLYRPMFIIIDCYLVLHHKYENKRYDTLKQLLVLHPFQNLLLIVYDHINYDLRDYSASIWAKQQEATASSSECSCLRPCILMSLL